MLLHSNLVAGASTQTSLVCSVIAKTVVAENATGSSGGGWTLQDICIQLCWLDLSFCPELCFQCVDSPLKYEGVTKHGAEDTWGTYYVIFNGMLKIWRNKVNPFWKAWLVLALKFNCDKVLQPGFFLLPWVTHDLSKGHGFFVGPEKTYIQSSACGSETADIWLEWRLIAPGPAYGTWSHFSMLWSPN